jgi:hypothetical protein
MEIDSSQIASQFPHSCSFFEPPDALNPAEALHACLNHDPKDVANQLQYGVLQFMPNAIKTYSKPKPRSKLLLTSSTTSQMSPRLLMKSS